MKMKLFLYLLLIQIATLANAEVRTFSSLECRGISLDIDKTRILVSVEEVKTLEVYRVRGHRGGGSFQRIYEGPFENQQSGAHELYLTSKDASISIEILLEEEYSWGYTGPGLYKDGKTEEPLECTVRKLN